MAKIKKNKSSIKERMILEKRRVKESELYLDYMVTKGFFLGELTEISYLKLFKEAKERYNKADNIFKNKALEDIIKELNKHHIDYNIKIKLEYIDEKESNIEHSIVFDYEGNFLEQHYEVKEI